MAETRRPRLRLSRRRPPPGGGSRSETLLGGGGESAGPWAELLRAARADLNPDGELPPLPAFLRQESGQRPEPAAPPEAFTVGLETFSWTPFPPAPRGGGGLGHSRHVLRGAGGLPGSPARSPRQCLAPKLPSTQEQRLVDGAQILRSCPMCQADFAPGLAQLDIDSHLAQCLEESTEDVVW
ncbi:Fanconi anemia core complex-associated protein 20 isoform X3 [Manis pentadactyla]|uniref:Fanconi anemia core complex-associated protein 20 isoform X3 n=1 Tax=Manis pentadactyla TaxID=143292 RepID=UPI001875B526|nr:Fanconi anemia core complex-associated protein 20 isoform X3 [Manis pentadactyla]